MFLESVSIRNKNWHKNVLLCHGKREKGSNMSQPRSLYDNPYKSTENKLDGWKEACGAETYEEWIHYAEKMIAGRNSFKTEK